MCVLVELTDPLFLLLFISLPNLLGGGIPESKRALELAKLLGGVNILASQVSFEVRPTLKIVEFTIVSQPHQVAYT